MAEIVKTDDVLGGKARLAGRRISVFQISEMYTRAGHSAESIANQLDLAFAKVHRYHSAERHDLSRGSSQRRQPTSGRVY